MLIGRVFKTRLPLFFSLDAVQINRYLQLLILLVGAISVLSLHCCCPSYDYQFSDTDRSITLPSKLISLFLKRNFFRPPWLATSFWHFSSNCSNTA